MAERLWIAIEGHGGEQLLRVASPPVKGSEVDAYFGHYIREAASRFFHTPGNQGLSFLLSGENLTIRIDEA